MAIDRPQTEHFDEDYSAHVCAMTAVRRGPNIDSCSLSTFEHIFDLTVLDVMRIAAERWNDRHAKARSLYDAGDNERLNLFPRNDEPEETA
ncbi:hypothetical protein NWF32_21075 [Pseudomonas qingdaonensis]|nr:hypothetical protein [Pseudomonas qingdaonensis]